MNNNNDLILLNSNVIPQGEGGIYENWDITEEAFVKILKKALVARNIVSYIGYTENLLHIQKLTGYKPEYSRTQVENIKTGDDFLICRLSYRVIDPETKKIIKVNNTQWAYSYMICLAKNTKESLLICPICSRMPCICD